MNNTLTAIILAMLLGMSSVQTGTVNLNEKHEVVPTTEEIAIIKAEDFKALNSFSAALWSNTASGENEMLSPLSAYLALAMCANGARGDTLNAFSSLGFTLDEDTITETNRAIRALITDLSETKGSTSLNIANSVWIDKSFEVNTSFLHTLSDYYSAEAFSAKLSDSVDDVNSWIEEKTNGLIADMLEEIDPSIMLLLINAIYMKAEFKIPFEKAATREDDFHLTSGEVSITDFMNRVSFERIIETEDAIGVILPYDDNRLEFVALMPADENMTTDELILSLNGEYEIGKLAAAAERKRVSLSIPKFEADSSLSLGNALKALGMGPAFSQNADFSGIGFSKDNNKLSIGEVLQNARLKLDENGTEAAAATVVTIRTTSIIVEEPAYEISFNRPFVYAVIDGETGAILFCGEYNSPQE